MAKWKRLKRLRLYAIALAIPFAILALAYCWLAFRPTGYRSDERATAAAIAGLRQRLDEAAASEAPPPISPLSKEDLPGLLARLKRPSPASGESDHLDWLNYAFPPLSSEESEISSGEGLAPDSPELLRLAVRAVVAKQKSEPDYTPFPRENPVPLDMQAAIQRKRIEETQELLLRGDFSDAIRNPPAMSAIYELGPTALAAAALAGRGDEAGAMLQNIATAICKDRLDTYPWERGGNFLARLAAGAAEAKLPDPALAQYDRILRAASVGEKDAPAMRQKAANDFRQRIVGALLYRRSTLSEFLLGMASKERSGGIRDAPARAFERILGNAADRMTGAMLGGDPDAIHRQQRSVRRLAGWLGLDGRSLDSLNSAIFYVDYKIDDPAIRQIEKIRLEVRADAQGFGSTASFNLPIEEARVILAFGRFRNSEGREPDSIEELVPKYLAPEIADGPNGRWLIVRTPPVQGPDIHLQKAELGDDFEAYRRFLGSVRAYLARNRSYPETPEQLGAYFRDPVAPETLQRWFRRFDPQSVCIRLRREAIRKNAIMRYASFSEGIDKEDLPHLRAALAAPASQQAAAFIVRAGIPEELKTFLAIPPAP